MATALPADIRLMNATAALVGVLALGVLALGAASWVARQPAFALRQIRLEGETARNNAATVRAHVMPRLAGNFFTLNLQAAREAFEAVPWVRHAVVRKVWPNRLVVQLEEHRPVAVWKGEEGDDRLVNPDGSRRFAATAPANVVSAHCFGSLYHEIFNEVEREAVFGQLKTWLDARF